MEPPSPFPVPFASPGLAMAYAYHLDAGSPRVQSGRPHSLLTEFRAQGVQIQEIFPLVQTARLERLSHKIVHRLLKREYLLDRHEKLLRGFAREIALRLHGSRPDVLFSPSTLPFSYLETETPTCICSDAPFHAMRGYYHSFSRLGARQIALAERLEHRVLRRVELAAFPSRWAADAAVAHYGLAPEKVVVIPFGANAGRHNQRAAVQDWIAQRPGDELRLLFVGLEWERKGGPLVLDTVRELERRGFRVRLDIVGHAPVSGSEAIRVHGPLRASVPAEAAALEALFQRSHFLFVPSRAEAYGMVFCEANAFGLPAIATATGGISEIIRRDVNGEALAPEATAVDYADAIGRAFDPATYPDLALRSFDEFATRLNWSAHCEQFLARLRERLAQVSPAHCARPPTVTTGTRTDSTLRDRPLRVAYVTSADPADPYAWSGLNFAIHRSLAALGVEIVPIGSLRSGWAKSARAWSYASRVVLRRQSIWTVDPKLLRQYGAQVAAQLAEEDCDVVLSPGTHPLAYLETPLPVVFWTDAPFAAMLDYYPWYSRVSARSTRYGLDCDDRALRQCAAACYSSEWAAAAAIRQHGIDPAKVEVIPFGANLPSDVTERDLLELHERRLREPWRLLFVGVEWERKGGDIALEVARQLNAAGHATELIVVGCRIPKRHGPLPGWVREERFVSQHTAEGRVRLSELYRTALFFLMPSRAEAYGIVFCEACSHALPCLAFDTGGVGAIVHSGENGMLLPPNAPPAAFTQCILECMREDGRYAEMMAASLRIARERLNWAVSARRLKALLEKAVAEHPMHAEVMDLP